ncbi:MAG: methylated-DNA--[protein]-cysteine S-methyltransferase [Pseudomonadales bacterium]
MIYSYLDTPVGRLLLAAADGKLKRVVFPSGSRAGGPEPGWTRHDDPFHRVRTQLLEYFAGRRRDFDLPLAPDATPFQAQVLDALLEIPYGETRSYKDIAVRVGNPRAVRAVGSANGNNPLPIVIPCHRVIGSSGALTGFGGGLDNKRYLLDLERRHSGLFVAR